MLLVVEILKAAYEDDRQKLVMSSGEEIYRLQGAARRLDYLITMLTEVPKE